MKRFLLLSLVLLIPLLFMGCASNRNPTIQDDLTQETWLREVETNPNKWAAGADAWFLTGDPNATERMSNRMPYSDAMSTLQVSVANFSNIKVNGAFQVQIFGTYDNNSVYVYGPNDAVREVSVEYKNGTLYVHQVGKVSPARMRSVIVRIGVKNLNTLTQMGCGTIEAIRIRSYALCIEAVPGATGDIYLNGNVNLVRVSQRGKGSINVFGANTPQLDIEANGWGAINICGNVGVRCITHKGWGDVNIIGANTDGLTIDADGKGKIGIKGIVNVKEIKAKGHTCVYICTSSSNSIYAYVYNSAVVGITGYTRDLTVNAANGGRFWGRYLCAQNAFVRAKDWAHINVAASDKIFASATQNASVYFFGEPAVMSQFVSSNGVVVPIWYGTGPRSCAITRPIVRARVYKDDVSPQGVRTYPYPQQHYRWVNKRLVGAG